MYTLVIVSTARCVLVATATCTRATAQRHKATRTTVHRSAPDRRASKGLGWSRPSRAHWSARGRDSADRRGAARENVGLLCASHVREVLIKKQPRELAEGRALSPLYSRQYGSEEGGAVDKRDELGSTRYDYRHARTQARILENVPTSSVRG